MITNRELQEARAVARRNLHDLVDALDKSWCAETSYYSGIYNTIPCKAFGQCAVTALIVQDMFGGEILRCDTSEGDSHYWNDVPVLGRIDLTTKQFDCYHDIPYFADYEIAERDKILENDDTRARYELLKEKVESHIGI